MINFEKQKLRKEFLNKRLNLSRDEVEYLSDLVIKNMLSLEVFKQAKNVMIYYPFMNEVNILKLKNFCEEKNFFFPVVDFENRELKVRKDTGKFVKNKFGIYEPEGEDEKNLSLEFIVVPGIVFDEKAYRLGYGGGYYDKFLSLVKNSFFCGVCYDFQIIKELPVNDKDFQLDLVVSEKRYIERR